MATVPRKFRDNFEVWSAHRIASGDWTNADVDEFKEMLRIDLAPGPDQLRAGVSVIIASGVEVPAAIDDHEARYQAWSDYFASEAEAIRQLASTAP